MPADRQARISRRAVLTGLGALLAAGCGRVEFMAANVPAVFGAYRRHPNISYGAEPQHRLDVYVPDQAPTGPRPLVVFWHGGRWEFGDKADYRFVGAALAELSYVSVLPNYRHYPQVKMPGFMDDAARAGEWAAVHAGEFGADAGRLYLMGHSAGAHMAALVSLDPRYFGAAGRPAPPMLLVHGLIDQTVRPRNSINLAAALRAHGVPATLKLYPKLEHGDTVAALSLPARGRAPTLADIEAFVGQPRSADHQAALAAGAGA